jgi:hypothetical protein
MVDLKVQHLIVMGALFVSLVGTLLLLGKINEDASPITGATSVVPIIIDEAPEENKEDNTETVVRIVDGGNQTDGG